MKKPLWILLLIVSAIPVVAQEKPVAAVDQHYRLLEAGHFEQARQQIHTADLRPEDIARLDKVMKGLQQSLLNGEGFAEFKITRKTPCRTECLLIGTVELKDGSNTPYAWRMLTVDGDWKLAYSRQLIQKHGS